MFEGDFALHREIPMGLAAGTRDLPRLVEVEWVRVEPVYGNAWGLTARVGWSSAAEATWSVRVELLDDKGGLLKHSLDRPTTLTGKADESHQDAMRYAEVGLDPMHWEMRRHAAKIHFTKAKFAWGVQSLPWLVLADAQHVVRAEGFAVNELDSKIAAMRQERNGNEP